ncbi:uncharacterized protein TNCV_2523501 [Trichonephila clavipes]|nr:uncharacterized protein TNCV_2523501 [Trichonephila clavipes]
MQQSIEQRYAIKFCVRLGKSCASSLEMIQQALDLTPADIFLFPKGKTAIKDRHHGALDDVKRACTHELKDAAVGDFHGSYEAWKVACRSVFMLKEHIWKTTKIL